MCHMSLLMGGVEEMSKGSTGKYGHVVTSMGLTITGGCAGVAKINQIINLGKNNVIIHEIMIKEIYLYLFNFVFGIDSFGLSV